MLLETGLALALDGEAIRMTGMWQQCSPVSKMVWQTHILCGIGREMERFCNRVFGSLNLRLEISSAIPSYFTLAPQRNVSPTHPCALLALMLLFPDRN
jgi:hypothetical protein